MRKKLFQTDLAIENYTDFVINFECLFEKYNENMLHLLKILFKNHSPF